MKADLTIGDQSYFTMRTVTAMLDIHRATIHEWIKAGRFPAPARRLGRMLLWTVPQIQTFTAGRHGQYQDAIFYEFAP